MRPEYDEYDTIKLQKALKLLTEVYEYNYSNKPLVKRLYTIMLKLQTLIKLNNDIGEKI